MDQSPSEIGMPCSQAGIEKLMVNVGQIKIEKLMVNVKQIKMKKLMVNISIFIVNVFDLLDELAENEVLLDCSLIGAVMVITFGIIQLI